MKSQKGAIELQFNWIFILLIGAVILIFFVTIVNQQQKVSNIKLAFQTREKLDAILAGAAAGPIERTESIEIPKLQITADCDNFYLGDKSVALPITIRPVFSPDLVQGDFLLLWSQDWSVPFAVSNFLYMTSPEVRYIFVDTEPLAQRVYKDLPETLSKEIVQPNALLNLTDKNNYKIRFVFFNAQLPTSISSAIKTSPNDITAINVKGTSTLAGEVDFYQGNPFTPKGSTKYIGIASLYGAIFSENKDNYDCLMNKAFRKLSLVAGVYLNRSSMLQNDLEDPNCKIYHAAAQENLMGLAGASAYLFPDYPEDIMKRHIAELIELNRQALDNSCPAIY